VGWIPPTSISRRSRKRLENGFIDALGVDARAIGPAFQAMQNTHADYSAGWTYLN
jgi:hypothetical protein